MTAIDQARLDLLAEVEQVAVQLGPLSSDRLRAWVATRREQLRQEAGEVAGSG
jgi:hypothetical protein